MSVDKGKTSAINFDAEFRRLSRRRRKVSRSQDLYEPDEEYRDAYSEAESGFESDDGVYEMPDPDDLIDFLVDNSKLDPIITIRRHKYQTAKLKRELKDLVEQKTLDPGQLKSFIESLVEPVHLTQGPPRDWEIILRGGNCTSTDKNPKCLDVCLPKCWRTTNTSSII